METGANPRRAHRYGVNWPVRVRRIDHDAWQAGKTLNLSVSGVLLQIQRDWEYQVGDRVEVEIEFLTQNHTRTNTISDVGRVVREDALDSGSAAIQFTVECELTPKAMSEPEVLTRA
jgi:hypothetical protein